MLYFIIQHIHIQQHFNILQWESGKIYDQKDNECNKT